MILMQFICKHVYFSSSALENLRFQKLFPLQWIQLTVDRYFWKAKLFVESLNDISMKWIHLLFADLPRSWNRAVIVWSRTELWVNSHRHQGWSGCKYVHIIESTS